MKRGFLLVAAVFSSSYLQAQQDSSSSTLLDQVIVTANKLPQKQNSTGKIITVISKEQLEKSNGKTIAQVLNEQAGIVVNGALNNAGTNQSLYLRGAATGRTLILLDGIPVYDPSLINNEFDLNQLAIAQVERIEICKGAQSTLYGSEAAAGVINIITTKSTIEQPLQLQASVTAGNYSTLKTHLQVFGKIKRFSYTVSYSTAKTKGFSTATDTTGKAGFDRDGFNSSHLAATFNYAITPQLTAKTFFQQNRTSTAIDAGAFTDSKDYRIKNNGILTGAGLTYKSAGITVTGNYQYSENNRNILDDSTDQPGTLFRGAYFGQSQFVELVARIQLNPHVSLIQGGDYRHSSMNLYNFGTYPASEWGPAGSYSSALDSSISQSSLFSSLLVTGLAEKLSIDLGARLNVNSRYGNNHSYTFNPSYALTKQIRVMGSISSGYKTPSVYQLYSQYGNQELKAEKSKTAELGLEFQHRLFSSRVVYFHRTTQDAIDFNYVSYKYFNLTQLTANGAELEIKAMPVKGLNITGNYSYLKTSEVAQSRIDFKDTVYQYALRRPMHVLNLQIGYQATKGLYASISAKAVSKRFDIGGYQKPDLLLPAYFIINAYAEYALTKQLKCFADVQNLTNKKFFDINGFTSIPFLLNTGIFFQL